MGGEGCPGVGLSHIKKPTSDSSQKTAPDASCSASNSLMSALFWNAPFALALLRNQTIGMVNRIFLELTGESAEELAGRRLRIFYGSKAEYENFFVALQKQIKDKGKARLKTTWLCGGTRGKDLEITAMPLEPGKESGQLCLGLREGSQDQKGDMLLDLQTSLLLDILQNGNSKKVFELVANKIMALPGIDGLGGFWFDGQRKTFKRELYGKVQAFFQEPGWEIWIDEIEAKYRAWDRTLFFTVNDLPEAKKDLCLSHGVEGLLAAPLAGYHGSAGWLLAASLGLKSLSRMEEKFFFAMTSQLAICWESQKINQEALELKRHSKSLVEKHQEIDCLPDENCWHFALNAMPQMICVREPVGGYRFCNRAMADFFGLKPEEVGKQVEPLLVGEGRSYKDICQEEEEIIKTGKARLFKETMLDAKGRPHEFEVLKSPLPKGQGVFISAVDVTEKKFLENQLRQAQKMEAMGSLAGGIAHDFNNILTAIMGYAELAAEDLPKEHNSRLFMQQVLKAGGRARELVRQILAFSRQETLEMKPLNLSQILCETINLLRASIPTSVDIKTQLNASRGLVMADQSQLQQIIMNLSANAAHAMQEKGGILEVSLAQVQLIKGQEEYDLRSGDYLKLVFSDTGCGMDKNTMERIFEPFFTTKKSGEGTGMGLSMVRRIVLTLGGEIKAKSTPGVGSVFEVVLPEFKGEEKADAVFDSARTKGGAERILFVDDETSLVELGTNMLGRLGYKVTGLNSSSQALELFNQDPHAFDLVVTDQTMPGVSGADLARRFLRTRPELPIILCTGFSAQISRDTARKMGISRFLMKPVEISEIARVVREVLDETKATKNNEFSP